MKKGNTSAAKPAAKQAAKPAAKLVVDMKYDFQNLQQVFKNKFKNCYSTGNKNTGNKSHNKPIAAIHRFHDIKVFINFITRYTSYKSVL